MRKKNIIFILIAVAVVLLLSFLFWDRGIEKLFAAQYNSHGVSHFLVITVDESRKKEYIGDLEGHSVYMEKLNIDETNFRTKEAKNLSVKDAIDRNLVSIEEWKKYAQSIQKSENAEILRFENYEIVLSDDACIIKPRFI